MKKKFLATIGAVLGLSLLISVNIPTSTKADSNLLLASVEWVQAQLNPIQTKVTALEKKVAEQDEIIKQLQKAVAEGGNGVVTKPPAVPSNVIAKQAVNVRKGATTNYKSLELVAKGTNLKYLGSFKNASGETWYNVQTAKGTKGWVLSTLTEVK